MPAPKRPNTAAATAATIRKGQDAIARKLLSDERAATVDRFAEAEGLITKGQPHTAEMLLRLVDEALTARRSDTNRPG